ncbi:unnamed protein product [Rodentolepis nana]|uniref:FAR1 domain-containing protein n=1 Tax=Rodentolepis nana TaxID=102285 RepID=A0A0R3TRS5_RODNA|nr:unnamed protein product [Rodentolepis nana]
MSYSTEDLEESSWNFLHDDQLESLKESHDITEQFLEVFKDSDFSTFESLRVALGEFSQKTGFIYTVKRSKRYRENDVRRHALVYNNICYGCTLHVQGTSNSVKSNESPCSSTINFSSVKGTFRVTKFSLVHNHPPPLTALNLAIHPSVFPAFIDCGESFRLAFPLMSVGSYSELAARLKHFEKRTGSVYIKYSTGLFSDTVDPQEVRCKYKKIRYVCVHYGSRKSEPIRRRNQHTTKIGCGSCFSVKYKDGRLHIVSYDMKHCHPVDPESARLYPHNRRLSPSETAEIEELLDVNASINEVKRIIKGMY